MRILKPLPGTLPMPGHPLADAVALWPFNSLGNKVFDLSGNGNLLTLYNTAAWVAGRFGPVITGNYLERNSQIVSSYPFTMAVWIKTSTAGNWMSLIWLGDKDTTDKMYWLWFKDGAGKIFISARNVSEKSASSTNTFNDGEWHHVVGVFKNNWNRKLYVDSVLEASSTISVSYTSAVDRISIGRLGDSTPGSYFSGEMDIPMMWNRALSASEIALLYREPFCMFPETIMPEFAVVA